jgi:hypothetical protein
MRQRSLFICGWGFKPLILLASCFYFFFTGEVLESPDWGTLNGQISVVLNPVAVVVDASLDSGTTAEFSSVASPSEDSYAETLLYDSQGSSTDFDMSLWSL